MADNTTLNAATVGGGQIIATDDIGGVQYQRVKLIYGADGVNAGDVADANPLPVLAEAVDLHVSRTDMWAGKAAKNVVILGRRTVFSSNTVLQDVATFLAGTQAAVPAVSAATQYFIVSTSANDTSAGTGARTVRIVYLDGAGASQVTTATMNGTTKVNLGTGFSAVQWMEVATLGTSGGVAEGSIAIFSGAGAAAAETTSIEQIQAGANRSLSGRYTIPAGHTGYLQTWGGSAPGNQAMDMRLRADVFSDDRTQSPGVFHFQAITYLVAASDTFEDSLAFLKMPAGSTVKISALPAATTGTPRADVELHLILVAN